MCNKVTFCVCLTPGVVSEGPPGFEYEFKIEANSKHYTLFSASAVEQKMWVKELQKHSQLQAL